MTESLRVEAFTGKALAGYVPELARLRIEVFREFPYLYDGDMAYEEKYLRTYIDAPDSVIVLAFDGDNVVGASTAIPMRNETEEVKAPFIAQGWDPGYIFYLGESVLQKRYRGRGVGVRFFEEREAHANRLSGFDYFVFCAVERASDHQRRPVDYVPLNDFWRKRGYVKHSELSTTFTWRDLDEAEKTPKPMVYWVKSVDRKRGEGVSNAGGA